MGNMHFTSEAFEMSCQKTFMTNYVVGFFMYILCHTIRAIYTCIAVRFFNAFTRLLLNFLIIWVQNRLIILSWSQNSYSILFKPAVKWLSFFFQLTEFHFSYTFASNCSCFSICFPEKVSPEMFSWTFFFSLVLIPIQISSIFNILVPVIQSDPIFYSFKLMSLIAWSSFFRLNTVITCE